MGFVRGVQGRNKTCRALERSGFTNKFESHNAGEHLKTIGILWAGFAQSSTCLSGGDGGRPCRWMLARVLSGTVNTAIFT